MEDWRRSFACRDDANEEDEDDSLDSWTYFRGGRLGGGGVPLEEDPVSSCGLDDSEEVDS
jgi:hypothetical protein